MSNQQIFDESKKYMPGGVNSPVRAYRDIDIQINSNDYEKVLFTITRDGVVKAKRIN